MIKRLSTTITAVKDWVRSRLWARLAWYFAVLLALVLCWAFWDGQEISFLYNAF